MRVLDLYQKVSEFTVGPKAQALSHCQKGCSRCCYVDLSVFQVESNNIESWFRSLSVEKQNSIREKWKMPLNSTETFHGVETKSCVFLHEEACTIYEARPLICRTQGLAMKFKDAAEEYLDICPLNEEMLDELTEKEVLNLDLLNMILSQLEKVDAKNISRERVKLSDLRARL
ncbi:YkgJ family cysteine cluster protein [Peredibacter sp. HCB2-198]|uniref:YkgJ family cysteine cluster protein n=1 Tax=Peredibacter sp. HCB2-198 TaxID=3383025 RepID=UPI0038B57F7E